MGREELRIFCKRKRPPGPTPAPAPVPTGPSGSVPPNSDGSCPSNAPIKGNAQSGIYHAPGKQSYGKTKAEQCFASGLDAEAAGFRAARK